MESENLKKLKELTPRLGQLTLGHNNPGKNFIEYDVENGTCIGFGLHNEDAVAVQRTFMSKGTSFPEHSHEEWELFLVYHGHTKVKYNNTEVDLKKTEYLEFKPNEPHSAYACEDTWFIAVSIPSGEGFAHA